MLVEITLLVMRHLVIKSTQVMIDFFPGWNFFVLGDRESSDREARNGTSATNKFPGIVVF